MKNQQQNELQELSAQDLANISGGIIDVSQIKDVHTGPDIVEEGEGNWYQTDNIYPSNLRETIAKQLENVNPLKPSFENS